MMRNVTMLVVLGLFLSLPAVAGARQVFLTDGGVIDCRSFKMMGGNVRVLVNRDTVVDLSAKEVDMKRTFARKGAKKRHARKKAASDQ